MLVSRYTGSCVSMLDVHHTVVIYKSQRPIPVNMQNHHFLFLFSFLGLPRSYSLSLSIHVSLYLVLIVSSLSSSIARARGLLLNVYVCMHVLLRVDYRFTLVGFGHPFSTCVALIGTQSSSLTQSTLPASIHVPYISICTFTHKYTIVSALLTCRPVIRTHQLHVIQIHYAKSQCIYVL